MTQFMLCSDLDNERGLGGRQSLYELSAPPGQAFMARVELLGRKFTSGLELSPGFAAPHFDPLERTVTERADGTFEEVLSLPQLIRPEDVSKHCDREIAVDEPVTKAYLDHRCAEQRRLDTLHSRSVRSDSELVDTLSLPLEAIGNAVSALDIVVSRGRRIGSNRRRSKEHGERQESATERIATAIVESTKDAFLTELILQTDAMTSPGIARDPFSHAFFNSILTGAFLDLIGLSPSSRSKPSVGRGNVGGG